jgi:hypothetical protein
MKFRAVLLAAFCASDLACGLGRAAELHLAF